jgi:hypothetical protein
MTPQEQQLIDGLIGRIRSTPATDKDVDADKYLHHNLDSVPDALYVLSQTVLVQQYGLQNAQQQLQAAQQQVDDLQAQLEQARAQAQQPQKSGSFLGHLFGTDTPQQQASPQGYQPVNAGYPAPPPPPYGQPGYGQQGYGQSGYVQAVPVQPMGYGMGSGMGGGGFLRGALQTAAGVAAGELVFQGMEDMFRGFGHEGGGYGDRPTEVINNNYYDKDRPESHEHREAGSDDSSFYNAANDASRQDLSPDIEDRRGFASNDATGDNTDTGDAQGFDDTSSNDDSGFDDSSSDDGGGYDDSSN